MKPIQSETVLRKICVVTGSRAEYGLLRWVMQGLRDSSNCHLQVIATGMHLSPEFGSTWRVISDDGFEIDWKVEMLLSSDTSSSVTKSMGLAMTGFADAFVHLKPDLVVALGDRFEIFAAASAAMIANIPIAHLHGGEITEGAFDDAIRHAITKMSHLHFTAAEPYRQRVIQMGENPEKVWNVGGFGLDSVMRLQDIATNELEEFLGMKFGVRNLLITYHPETSTGVSSIDQMSELLSALNDTDAQLIFTMPNADTSGRELFAMIRAFVDKNAHRACAHVSLGQTRYFSVIRRIDGVVGNSSSGLIEVPAFKKGAINIGARQDGRLRAESVIDCKANYSAICEALQKLYSPDFQAVLQHVRNPYGAGGASAKTVNVLETIGLPLGLKRFCDIT